MTHERSSRALVLGAGGRLGTMLRRIWTSAPPDGLEIFYQSRDPLDGDTASRWLPGDDPAGLPKCDTVIALWGQTGGDAAALDLNVTLARESRHVATACGASRLLHLSSAAVYGPAQNATEATPASPINSYGQSKLAMEVLVADFKDAGLHHCCLRLANVVGADSLAAALRDTAPVTLDRFADGRGPLRSYIGAGDLANVLAALARQSADRLPGILNVAAHAPIAMQDLIEASGNNILWRDAPAQAVQEVTLDTSALKRLLPHVTPETDPVALVKHLR